MQATSLGPEEQPEELLPDAVSETSDYLIRFCFITDEKREAYNKVFSGLAAQV
jgi:hypothetical protein